MHSIEAARIIVDGESYTHGSVNLDSIRHHGISHAGRSAANTLARTSRIPLGPVDTGNVWNIPGVH